MSFFPVPFFIQKNETVLLILFIHLHDYNEVFNCLLPLLLPTITSQTIDSLFPSDPNLHLHWLLLILLFLRHLWQIKLHDDPIIYDIDGELTRTVLSTALGLSYLRLEIKSLLQIHISISKGTWLCLSLHSDVHDQIEKYFLIGIILVCICMKGFTRHQIMY